MSSPACTARPTGHQAAAPGDKRASTCRCRNLPHVRPAFRRDDQRPVSPTTASTFGDAANPMPAPRVSESTPVSRPPDAAPPRMRPRHPGRFLRRPRCRSPEDPLQMPRCSVTTQPPSARTPADPQPRPPLCRPPAAPPPAPRHRSRRRCHLCLCFWPRLAGAVRRKYASPGHRVVLRRISAGLQRPRSRRQIHSCSPATAPSEGNDTVLHCPRVVAPRSSPRESGSSEEEAGREHSRSFRGT
jgi:hypothetical protein